MKHQTVKIFSSVEHLSNCFACLLKEKNFCLPEGDNFNIAVSGGSTPAKIFKFIKDNFADKINWNKINIFFGDERCVPPEDDDSNFKMVNENLLKYVSIPKENIFRIFGEEDPGKEVERYSEIIKKNIPLKNNTPQFDLIMLGLGEDGHTASIFPDQISLFHSTNNCEVAVHPTTGQKRITLTGKIINNAKVVVFIATGENKTRIVYEIIGGNSPDKIYPASLVEPSDLIWMLDTPAVQLLDSEIKKLWYVK